MEQVFRIEIPVEAVDKSDAAALQRLESVLQKLFSSMKQNKTTSNELFDAIEQGASEARSTMQQASTAAHNVSESYEEVANAAGNAGDEQSQASKEAATASEKLENQIDDLPQAYEKAGSSAAEAGRKSGSAFTQASTNADRFTQRIEKSNRTLRNMFKEKLNLTLAAIDRASPVLKNIWNSTKNLAGKTWHIVVRMKDFVTAPFRKLYHMISNPITMALSIAGVGLGAGDVLSTFTDFKSGMSTVKALTGATEEEFIQLTETAENLGATTKFTATEASSGMKYLAMAGWETNQIVEAMPGLLNLAAAGATDLGTAADIVSDVMTAMGMAAGEAGRAADIFAKTSTSSNTTIEGLGNTLKYAAPIAHSFGMTLEDVAAAAGLMANAGIKGEMAGTALRASLLRMSSPTSDMLETMKQLGISFSEENGQMKNMSTIIRSLETSFAGLSQSQRLEYAQTLFGTEAASAWLGLIDQGADSYDRMSNSLYNCAGAAEKMAKTQLDNLAGDMTLLQSAVDGMKISLVDKLDPHLRKGVQWLTGKIPSISQMLSDLIDKGAAKASELKTRLSDVFDSQDWKNADGFADKFFIAWDKIIAEPFDSWWQGKGRGKMLDVMEKLGKSAGDLLHGTIVGSFAALKGEELDLEGLNITGLGKAGAEAAKVFVSSFLEAFDLGGLASEMPGAMKAGLLGFGAIKLGQGSMGIYKNVIALKEAFAGVAATAQTTAPVVASVGTKAASSAIGIGKATTILSGLKTALAAVPVWGWVAAAAITAAAVGIKLYTDAQERQRQELLHASDAGAEAAEQYRASARQYIEYSKGLSSYREHKVKLEAVFKPVDKQTILDAITDLEGETIELETVLANGGLSDLERAKLSSQILQIEANRIALTFTLQEPTQEEKNAIIQQVSMLEEQKIEIQALIDGGGLPAEDIEALETQITELETSQICLKAALEPLTEKEIELLTGKLDEIEADKIRIQALIDGGGLPPEQISALEQQIDGLNKREVLIKATLGSLSNDEIAQYAAQQLGIDYDKLVELSGGVITQADVAAGRTTDEDAEYVAQHRRMQMETDLYNLQAEVQRGRELLPGMIEQRAQYQNEAEYWASEANNTYDDKKFLGELEARRANALARYNAGEIDQEALMNEGISIVDTYKGRFGEGGPLNAIALGISPELLFGSYGGGLFGSGLFGHFIADRDASNNDTFTGAIEWLEKDNAYNDERRTGSEADYTQQNAAIIQQYQNEKALIEGWSFIDSDFAGQSIETVAASYATLDAAGQQMFANAIAGLAQLNETTGYITEDEKVGVQTVLEQAQQSVVVAANTEIIGEVKTKLSAIAESYKGLESDAVSAFNTEHIDAVNAALEFLGLDKVESLEQINDTLAQITAIDPSGLDFSATASSLEALGGSADSAREKVAATKSQLDQLQGTYSVTISVEQVGSILPSLPTGPIRKNAAGGIYDGAMLSWVAEDGPEAIIPLGSKRRERGLDLWMQAGKMLGVAEFAEGGILAPYSGPLQNLSDDVWDNDDGSNKPSPACNSGKTNDRTISVSIAANPTFQIEGSSNPDEILAILKAKQNELAEIFGGAIADQLEDIVSNMV